MNKYTLPWPPSAEEFESRDNLVASAYEAAVDPNGYGTFLAALASHLDLIAGKLSALSDFQSADFTAVESDRGLIEHLRKAGSIIERLESIPKFGTLPQRVMSSSAQQVLFDEKGKLLAQSASAIEMVDDASLSFDILLENLYPDDARHLRQMQNMLARGESPLPIVARGSDLHLIARCVYPEARLSPSLLVESLDVPWSAPLSDALRKSFGLTGAELQIVEFLSKGSTISAISQSTGKKEGTVRNQVKSVLSKTGINNQANLMRLVVKLSGVVPPSGVKNAATPASQGVVDVLVSEDGRAIEVRSLGPTTGRGLLFVHGQLFGTEMPTEVLDYLEEHNLRLICPSRPGFGCSDPYPGNVEAEPKRLSSDFSIVMDHFGLDRTVLIANITGSLYAYAIASEISDRITGIVCAGGVIPMNEARQYVDAAPRQRIIAYLGRFAPALLPPILQSGISQIREGGELAFLQGLYQDGTRDRMVLHDPEKKALLERSVHFGVSQGYHGVYNDTYHLVRDWSPWVTATASQGIPSIHIHGQEDPAIAIASVHRFASRHSNVKVRGVEGSGQLVFFDRPLPVFEAASELLAP